LPKSQKVPWEVGATNFVFHSRPFAKAESLGSYEERLGTMSRIPTPFSARAALVGLPFCSAVAAEKATWQLFLV
jgi:hypothetical protein